MKNVKKIFLFIFTIFLGIGTLFNLSACSNNKDEKISVVCTIFPEYDWVKEVIGENNNIKLTLLLNNGVDLHNYEPSVSDIAKISTCDLFIYVGGESDKWVSSALKNARNTDMQVINLLDVLGDKKKEEEQKEGMQEEEDKNTTNNQAIKNSTTKEIEYDEHVWLSLRNTQLFVNEIANKLSVIDSSNKDKYTTNATEYNAELNNLDEEYTSVVNNGNKKTLLFGDRFPFRYFVDDYGLDYFAAFSGCSTETEASFDTITTLAGKVDALNLKVILRIETSTDDNIANQIKNNTTTKDQEILILNSIQNTIVESGKTYLSIMQDNLEVIRKAVM